MLESTIPLITQFGAAGLIGALWLIERKHAAQRDRQIDEAHRKLIGRERELEALLRVVRDNTRAIHQLDQSQRRMMELLKRTLRRRRRRRQGASKSAEHPRK
ncbi:MAG: hypothetical protein EA377_01040 [Phycisphaerales bacterium]|nr:MAG: hypothetical protein EA377_01040 [Phycisphaerales bacterium]